VMLDFGKWLIRRFPGVYLIGRAFRTRLVINCDADLYPRLSRDNLRYIECDKSSLSVFCMRRLVPIVRTSPFPLDEFVVLYRPKLIIDWRTHIGASARVFYETCRWYGVKAEIQTIDLPEDVYHPKHRREMYALLLRNTSVHFHRGDGAEVAVRLI